MLISIFGRSLLLYLDVSQSFGPVTYAKLSWIGGSLMPLTRFAADLLYFKASYFLVRPLSCFVVELIIICLSLQLATGSDIFFNY